MPDNTSYALPSHDEKTKVIKGEAQIDKPSLSKKIVSFLVSDKIDSIGDYLANYILGPGLKKLAYDICNNALQMFLLGGQASNQPNQNYWSNGWNNGYNSARRDPYYYNQQSYPGYAQPQPGLITPKFGLNDISFATKDDAYLVLDRMNVDIGRYGKVRVADFYTYAGITGQEGNWTLQGNGWYDLNQAHPMQRTDLRWIIDFPPVQTLR